MHEKIKDGFYSLMVGACVLIFNDMRSQMSDLSREMKHMNEKLVHVIANQVNDRDILRDHGDRIKHLEKKK